MILGALLFLIVSVGIGVAFNHYVNNANPILKPKLPTNTEPYHQSHERFMP